MYCLYRPIDMWNIPHTRCITISIVSEKIRLSLISEEFSEDNTDYSNPLTAVYAAISLNKKLDKKVKYIVCDEQGTVFLKTKLSNKLLDWANNEFKSIKKCEVCNEVLADCGEGGASSDGTCSSICRLKRSKEQQETLNDNEETEFYL